MPAASYNRWARLPRALLCALQVMFQELKFKSEPLEWVYDGLSPALLGEVVACRKGTPLALALVFALAAQRLGLQATALCTHDQRPLGTQQGN